MHVTLLAHLPQTEKDVEFSLSLHECEKHMRQNGNKSRPKKTKERKSNNNDTRRIWLPRSPRHPTVLREVHRDDRGASEDHNRQTSAPLELTTRTISNTPSTMPTYAHYCEYPVCIRANDARNNLASKISHAKYDELVARANKNQP